MYAVQRTHPAEETARHWRPGLQALACAFLLGCVGIAYHAAPSVAVATGIAAYALLGPLRVQSLLLSRATLLLALHLAVRGVLLSAAVYLLSFDINSSAPIAEVIGTLAFVAVLIGVAAALGATGKRLAWAWVPRAWRKSSSLALSARMHVTLVVLSLLPWR